ncbi:MAG: PIN domain-containing protein [Gaiella sp.]
MARVLLDTTVLIDVLRGRHGTIARLRGLHAAGDVAMTSVINAEEVVRGLRPGERPHAERLLAGLTLAPLRMGDGLRAGDWRREYAARGLTLTQADCLVAAAALGMNARLATANVRDFPMQELSVELWPGGE